MGMWWLITYKFRDNPAFAAAPRVGRALQAGAIVIHLIIPGTVHPLLRSRSRSVSNALRPVHNRHCLNFPKRYSSQQH